MIGRLVGVIAERHDDGTCVIDVAGVGYEVLVPLGTLGRLAESPTQVTLYIHTHVREDALTLYGFASLDERATFRALISVAGVGPKTAVGILSAIDAPELAHAIQRGDTVRLKGIPGVGKKTVERLVLELKDKLPLAGAIHPPSKTTIRPAAITDPLAVVANALVQLGYKPSEAERAIAQLGTEIESKPTEVLLREALASLA